MNHFEIAVELKRNRKVFKNLFRGLSREQYIWRPGPDKWCLLEILCHLYDEEREDFRARVQHVLTTPADPMTPIDPVGWVTARKYMERDYAVMLDKFLAEREASVAYLEALSAPLWDNVYQHPKLGVMPASLFLNNWLAHDYLHFRQITGVKYQYLRSHMDDKLDYAGSW